MGLLAWFCRGRSLPATLLAPPWLGYTACQVFQAFPVVLLVRQGQGSSAGGGAVNVRPRQEGPAASSLPGVPTQAFCSGGEGPGATLSSGMGDKLTQILERRRRPDQTPEHAPLFALGLKA